MEQTKQIQSVELKNSMSAVKDYYLNSEHPLHDSFTIKNEWTTPIGQIQFSLPEDMRLSLINYIAKKGYCSTMGTHKGTQNELFEERHYNMFDESDSNEHIEKFEEYATELIRFYIANAWGLRDAANLDISARAFGNMQTYGGRTYPHYHHGFDGVFVHYLTMGNEFTVEQAEGKEFYDENGAILKTIAPDSKIERTNKKEDTLQESFGTEEARNHTDAHESQGNLILQDPRPSVSFPYNNKAISFTPKVGSTIFHPAYVWHESNEFKEDGLRIAVIVNFRVNTRNNSDLISPLKK